MRCANVLTTIALVLAAPAALVAAQEPSPSSSTSTETVTVTVSRVVATATVTTENPSSASSMSESSSSSLSGVVMNTTTTSTTADYTSFHYSTPSGAPTNSRNGTTVSPSGQPPVQPASGAASTFARGGLVVASLVGLVTWVLADAL